MAGIAGLVSAGVGLYGALSSNPTANNVNVPQPWVMPGMTQAADNAMSGIMGLPGQGLPPELLQQFQNISQSLYNNPYAQQYQQGANAAAPLGQNAAQSAYGLGQNLQQQGQSLVPYASQIEQTAFDPQNALYARTLQQVQDQTRSGQAARGVATTPYGAEGEADQLRKFNIDWQNQQLQRQGYGAQAAGGLLTQGGQLSSAGAGLQANAVPQYLQSSGLPYSTYNTIGQGQLGAVNALAGGAQSAQGLALNPVQAYLSYLGLGNQAGGVANQAAQVGLNQANLGFNQSQTLGSQLGASIAGLGNSYKAGYPGVSSGWNWLNSGGGGGNYNSGTSYAY